MNRKTRSPARSPAVSSVSDTTKFESIQALEDGGDAGASILLSPVTRRLKLQGYEMGESSSPRRRGSMPAGVERDASQVPRAPVAPPPVTPPAQRHSLYEPLPATPPTPMYPDFSQNDSPPHAIPSRGVSFGATTSSPNSAGFLPITPSPEQATPFPQTPSPDGATLSIEQIIEMRRKSKRYSRVPVTYPLAQQSFHQHGVEWKVFKATHGRPDEDITYFKPSSDTFSSSLAVVIPIYNESYETLRMTLLSLQENMDHLAAKDIRQYTRAHVVIIVDGWHGRTAHHTTKAYLREMFSTKGERGWWEELEDGSVTPGVYETIIIQKKKCEKGAHHSVDVNLEIDEDGNLVTGQEVPLRPVQMLVTLIIKRDNRKKHNSHEWFLGKNGFAWAYRPEFVFATDCGTLFHDGCLRNLIMHMRDNREVAVATGRQRVMTRAQQGSDEGIISLGTLLRGAQMFDYESSFACFTGAFAISGFLPVIPGPCGLYRTKSLLGNKGDRYEDSPVKWYFDVVNTNPDESGLVLGNLRIAEDRVLSYSVVLKSKEYATMALVPDAVFYFEAETSLQQLALQRRRWLNGTWAGYFYLAIQKPALLFSNPSINKARALYIWFLLFLQLLIFAVVAISPGIFLSGLHRFISIVLADEINMVLPTVIWFGLVGYYVSFVFMHAREKSKYIMWMFNIQFLISCSLTLVTLTSFIVYLMRNLQIFSFDAVPDKMQLTAFIIVGAFVTPFLLAIMHSPFSFLLMILSVIPYTIFLPMLTGIFGAYAFARSFDLSWGNRPVSTVNVEPEMHELAKVTLVGEANTLCAVIVFINFLFLIVQEFTTSSYDNMFYLVCFIFASMFLQMLLGIPWFLWYDIRKAGRWIASHCLWFIFDLPPPQCCSGSREKWIKKQQMTQKNKKQHSMV